MRIKLELVRIAVADMVASGIADMDIDINKVANSRAIEILEQIRAVMQNDKLSAEGAVSEISEILRENNIAAGEW